MKHFSDLEDNEISLLADSDFQDTIQGEARELVESAFDTYRDVMSSSDDDVARVKAADKIISLAGYQEKQQSALPSGVSEEVFKLALTGLGQLAGIARSSSNAESILRNVSPAKTDPRPVLPEMLRDDSPMNKAQLVPDNESIASVIAKERYEIFERKPGD